MAYTLNPLGVAARQRQNEQDSANAAIKGSEAIGNVIGSQKDKEIKERELAERQAQALAERQAQALAEQEPAEKPAWIEWSKVFNALKPLTGVDKLKQDLLQRGFAESDFANWDNILNKGGNLR